MARKTKSALGEEVDFDLIDIKSQIAAAPKTVEVTAREDYVDKKLRRQVYKTAAAVKQKLQAAKAEEPAAEPTPAPVVEEPVAVEEAAPAPKKTRKRTTNNEEG